MKKLYSGIEELVTCAVASRQGGRKATTESLSIIPDGAILVGRDGLIEWVGEKSNASFPGVEVVDLKAKTVTPALIESHTHSIFAGDRAEEFELRLNGMSYSEISKRGGGIKSTMKATREASDENLSALLQERVHRFRKQGVSFIEVKTGYGLSVKEELRLLRVIKGLNDPYLITTFLGPHSSSPEFGDLESYLQALIGEALPQVAAEKLAHRVDIFIEQGFFTADQARRYFEAAEKNGFKISAHVEQLSQSGGIKQALSQRARSVDHCVHASDEDIQGLSKSETTAVLLPSADFYMGIDYPPARKMIDAGARVALSTDFNPGTSPSQSVELCSMLARLQMKMSLPEILTAWTVGAAHVLDLQDQAGSLEIGKRADFAVWEKSWRSFFYDFQKNDSKDLYLSGKRVAL